MSAPANQEKAFACRLCGACCKVEGYVRLRQRDIDRIAKRLGLTPGQFTRRYTRLTDDRRGLSLTEKPDGSCIFLGEDNRCAIQDAKPRQCREFPAKWKFDGYEQICNGAQHGC